MSEQDPKVQKEAAATAEQPSGEGAAPETTSTDAAAISSAAKKTLETFSEASPETLAAAAADAPSDRLAVLEAELAETKDKFMRAVADVQNARKRAEKERRDAEAYGGTKLARDLLPVYDYLEEALKLASDELREKEPGFFNGVDLTKNELLKAFDKHKIKRLEVEIGDKFDPNEHQAMFEAPSPGAEPGSVIQVMQAGFTISDRLLRPAMVGVARAVETAEPEGAAAD